MAIENFDGSITTVRANRLRVCRPTRECQSFWVMCLVVIGVMFFAGVMIIIEGPDSSNILIWVGLISAGLGVFIPSPKYKNATGKVSDAGTPTGPLRPVALRRSAPARYSV